MLKVKHLMDRVETDDGTRLWVEPVRLCTDLREWCDVDHVLCHIAPPLGLWRWFENHIDGYDYFRGKYHQHLQESKLMPGLQQLAKVARRENVTLLHQGSEAAQNTATALFEFLSELGAHSTLE